MWFSITPEISDIALNFAALNFAKETVHDTYDRMDEGNTPQAIERRKFRIYIGKVAEQVVFRYIRDILGLEITEDTHIGGPDRFDFKIEYENKPILGDVKSFHIYPTWKNEIRTKQQVEQQSSALVPVDQYCSRQPKDLYVFAAILGNKVGQKLDLASNKAAVCFMKWATYTEIGNWEFVRQGTPVFPYNRTKTDNYGQKMFLCKSMDDFVLPTVF